MNAASIRFGSKKQHRGWYLVEYDPPFEGARFATVNLVILEVGAEKNKIIEAMETEARTWLERYKIPVMVSAFDDKDDLIHLDPVKPSHHLMAIKAETTQKILWREIKDAELPDDALDRVKLTKIYHDIDFKVWTTEDRNRVENQHRKMAKTAWLMLFAWLVVVPSIVIILGETSVWVARIALAYSVWKIVEQMLKLTGHWKQSKRQEEQEREEREKNHHHYHCKRNPKGFLRLKNENCENENRERVRKEAEEIQETER
jgi:hypothetical protein